MGSSRYKWCDICKQSVEYVDFRLTAHDYSHTKRQVVDMCEECYNTVKLFTEAIKPIKSNKHGGLIPEGLE